MNPAIAQQPPQLPSLNEHSTPDVGVNSLTSLRQSAREHTNRGLFIFPCKRQGKEPDGRYAPHGFKSARNDDSALKPWDDGIAANIGVACEASGITVVDCDAGFNSEEEAIAWAHALGFDTLMVRTGRPNSCGVHFYFSGTMKSCSFELNGVRGQIKSAGGYVIGAGSVHESGKLYEVVHDAPMATLPECFASLGTNTKTKADSSTEVQKDLVPVGQRRNRLLRLAGILLDERLSEQGIYDALVDFLKNACENGAAMAMTDDDDIRRIAHDAATKWERNGAVAAPVVYVGKDSLPSPSSHMSAELYGFYIRALEQSKDGTLFFNGRKFAKKFQSMSASTAYRRAYELEESGWFELVRRGGNDERGHPQCTIYRIRSLAQWKQWRTQCPTTPVLSCQPSQNQTERCVSWLQKRLANGPVYSDELETERKALGHTQKVYRDARTTLNVNWSQQGKRRVSWIGSNGLIIGKVKKKHE